MTNMLTLPEDEKNMTKRSISLGAERWIDQFCKCLDHGFVRLVDYMGTDEDIARAARVSYGRGSRKASDDETLIRYLRRHGHTSPFEMVELKFHVKLPIFVARQWIRHRTANVNEVSGRYSEIPNEVYIADADVIRRQSPDNKQGRSSEGFSGEEIERIIQIGTEGPKKQFQLYNELLVLGVARELARKDLPLSSYTEWYWKIDLHNLMHFLHLRLDSHAQYEIRVYAEVIARIIKDGWPVAFNALEDYHLKAISFSRAELEILGNKSWPMEENDAREIISRTLKNKREAAEFIDKLKRLGFIK